MSVVTNTAQKSTLTASENGTTFVVSSSYNLYAKYPYLAEGCRFRRYPFPPSQQYQP